MKKRGGGAGGGRGFKRQNRRGGPAQRTPMAMGHGHPPPGFMGMGDGPPPQGPPPGMLPPEALRGPFPPHLMDDRQMVKDVSVK